MTAKFPVVRSGLSVRFPTIMHLDTSEQVNPCVYYYTTYSMPGMECFISDIHLKSINAKMDAKVASVTFYFREEKMGEAACSGFVSSCDQPNRTQVLGSWLVSGCVPGHLSTCLEWVPVASRVLHSVKFRNVIFLCHIIDISSRSSHISVLSSFCGLAVSRSSWLAFKFVPEFLLVKGRKPWKWQRKKNKTKQK